MDQERQQLKKPKFNPTQPPPLTNTIRRPYKGIFLTYFLFFCALLFIAHGFHKFNQYSFWDLVAVWALSVLLLIPGLYFGIIIIGIQFGRRGYSYKSYPELFH